MNYSLRNVKINKRLSEETCCFSATLCLDGKAIAEVGNRGCGGNNEIHFKSRELEKEFLAYVSTLPPDTYQDFTLPMDGDLFVGILLDKWQENDQIKRWCRKETLFRLKGDKQDSWRTLKMPYQPKAEEYLVTKYGEQIEEIANKRFISVP